MMTNCEVVALIFDSTDQLMITESKATTVSRSGAVQCLPAKSWATAPQATAPPVHHSNLPSITVRSREIGVVSCTYRVYDIAPECDGEA
jgi:hypothetical protein